MKRILFHLLTLVLLFAFTFPALTLSAQTVEQADSLHQRGRELLSEGKLAEGRECTRQAMEIRKKLLGEVSEDYITSLNNYALAIGMEENYAEAIRLQTQVLKLCDKLKTPHKNLGTYTMNMGRYYFIIEDYANASIYLDKSLPLVEKHGEIYEKILEWLGICYNELNDIDNMERIMALMEEHNQHQLTLPCDDPGCIAERAQYFAAKGETAKAKEYFLHAIAMPMDDEMKLKVYKEYIKFLVQQKEYVGAVEYTQMAANITKSRDGVTEAYINLLYNAAVYCFLGKQYAQAVDNYQIVADFYHAYQSSSARNNEAKCWKGIGNAYSGLHRYDMAKTYFLRLVEYYQQYGQNDNEYPKSIMKLATAEKFNKDYDASIEHHLQAMELFEQRGMNEEYADAVNSLQLCYAYAGKQMPEEQRILFSKKQEQAAREAQMVKLDQIIKEETANLELTRKYLGRLVYAHSLQTIAGCYSMKEQFALAIEYYKKYIGAIREAVRDEFRMQNEIQRMTLWNKELSTIKEIQELLVSPQITNEKMRGDLATIAYDAALLSKGILLKSSIEFERVLRDNGSLELLRMYEQTEVNEAEIAHLRQAAVSENDLGRILELTQQTQDLQLKLSAGCAEYADFTDYISYDWKAVQKALSPKDVAVEFVSVNPIVEGRDDYMVAIVLTKNMSHPDYVVLWENEMMDAIAGNSFLNQLQNSDWLFNTPEAGTMIWGALSSYLKGKQRIFFSADGCFNRIAVEYLPYGDKPLSEQFEVYRLSSTKELCRKHSVLDTQHPSLLVVSLFGDINYNEEASENTELRILNSENALRGSAGIGMLPDLGNTLREVNEIQAILKGKGVKNVVSLKNKEASRTAFLALSGTKVNLLHIATHGMYHEVKRGSDTESMHNSKLAFAGANIDDSAFASATDIASMNLRQCDLVVLSACETGLGKLGGDGVFGLQRGFKNAGVHTLLMSLKRVYDQSTADLMISFYRHLMNGFSKRKALVKAQQELRHKGFSDPNHWTSFILLDAF